MINIIYSFIVLDSASIPLSKLLIEFDCKYIPNTYTYRHVNVCLTILARASHRLLLTLYEQECARKEVVVLTRPRNITLYRNPYKTLNVNINMIWSF